MVKSYQDLIVWQKAMDLAVGVYAATKSFPKEETYGLTSQIRRAVVSISSNIAEGRSRNTIGEFIYLLGVAKGSVAELESQLILANRLGFLPDLQKDTLLGTCNEVSKMLMALSKKLAPST